MIKQHGPAYELVFEKIILDICFHSLVSGAMASPIKAHPSSRCGGKSQTVKTRKRSTAFVIADTPPDLRKCYIHRYA